MRPKCPGTFRKVDPADQGGEQVRRTLVVKGDGWISRVRFVKHENWWECVSAQEPLKYLVCGIAHELIKYLNHLPEGSTWTWEK